MLTPMMTQRQQQIYNHPGVKDVKTELSNQHHNKVQMLMHNC
jgi:hypothetical protein